MRVRCFITDKFLKNKLEKFLFFFIAGTVSFLLFQSPVFAQFGNTWADKMFTELGTVKTHDFGSVALHAEVEYRFLFQNIYKEDVVIESVSTTCSCTKASAPKQVIKSMETGEIVARIDTTGKQHTKNRRSTITVIFSRPAYAEVQLQVSTYIRSDVGFDPGIIEFGTVSQGTSVTKTAYLRYEGQPGWALSAIQKDDPRFKAEAQEIERQDGHVVYKIDVTLKNSAVSGYLNDLLRFKTNEVNSTITNVFLPVRGLVMEPLTATPSFFQMGVVHPGEKISKNLVIRASTPFTIKKVFSSDKHFSFLTANMQSTIHVIPVTYIADNKTGQVDQTITVETDHEDLEPLQVAVSAFVSDKK